MGTGVEEVALADFIGEEVGGSFLGDAFAGDALGSVIGDAGVGGSFLGDTAGASMLGNIGGASSLLGNIGGYGIGNLMNPSALGAYNGLEATSGLGIGNISNAAGIPMGSLNNIITPGNIGPSGIYSLNPGEFTKAIESVGGLGGVGNVITPTQELLANQYENVFTGAEDSTRPLTIGDGKVYTPSNANVAKPGYFSNTIGNLTKAFDPTSSTSAMDRLSALGNVGSDTFKATFLNKDDSLNMPVTLAALSLYPTYAAAKAKAGQIGVPFSEADYQAGKIAPSKERFAAMAPKSAFGIRSVAANGGRMGFGSGGMSDNRISQLIQLLRDADARGDQDTVDQIKLDLYRETRKATGGRIGYRDGKLVLDEGPANKATRLQMEKAAREAQKRYVDMKSQDKLMEENYTPSAMYDWKKGQKELFDMAPEEGYTYPEPTPPEGVLSIKLTPAQGKKKGGRISPRQNFGFGSMIGNFVTEHPNTILTAVNEQPTPIGLVDYTGTPWEKFINQVASPVSSVNMSSNPSYVPTNRPVNDLYQYYLNQENDEDKKKQIMSKVNPLFGIGKAHGGMMNHPIRRLQGGISELDLRAKGGFIPMGVKEKADDVPAMLSKNEFVFTADAVRNAGGGSINKGAQKMYKLMKSLENKKVNRKTN